MKDVVLLCLSSFIIGTAGFAQGNNDQVVQSKIEGNIYKPKQLTPTETHLRDLKKPEGFVVEAFATGVGKPRMIRVGTNGAVYVTDRDSGIVTLLRDTDKDGKADAKKVVFRKEQVHGIEFKNNSVYLITVKEVYKGNIQADGSFAALKPIVSNLPDGGQHANRTIKIGPDNKLYITVGSTCNACEETSKESATIIQTDLNGGNRKIFAKGLRNTIGFAWHPQSGELYGFDHGIDWLGDDEQKEEFNRIVQGGDYGWPYVFAEGKPNKADEPKGMTHAEYAAKTVKPSLLYTAHAAPMDMVFYTGAQFPSEYRNDVIATMHGSWNRETPSGYNIVRVHFENGKPVRMSEFITGFLLDNGQAYFARPCGLTMDTDGSLLWTDDALGGVYRIRYQKEGAGR